MVNTLDPKTGKRHKIFQDRINSGKLVEMKRPPFADIVKATFRERAARHKEWLRQGYCHKNHSTQKFSQAKT